MCETMGKVVYDNDALLFAVPAESAVSKTLTTEVSCVVWWSGEAVNP